MSPGLFSLAGVLGCTSTKDSVADTSTPPVETIDGVTVEANPNNPLSAFVVLTPKENLEDVKVVYGAGDELDFETPAQPLVAGVETRILVLGLEDDTDCKFRLEGTKEDGTPIASADVALHSGALIDGFPVPEIFDEATDYSATETICTNESIGDGDIYCMDREGRPRWILHSPDGQAISTFRPMRSGNFVGVSVQQVSLFDPTGARLNTFTVGGATGTRFEHQMLDPREAIEITEGPWDGDLAIETATIDTLTDGTQVEGHGIIVYDPETNGVVWDWLVHGKLGDDQTIDPDKLDYKRVGLAVSYDDWDHDNALLHGVESNGDQFFWISMRHQDWIVKLNCQTDKIEWRFGRDGDFQLQDEDGIPYTDDSWYMYQQHAPEWESHKDGKYDFFVYDNGESRMDANGLYTGPKYSRLLRFELDENTMTARKVWDFGSPDLSDPSHFYGNDHGSVMLLPGGQAVQYVRQGDDGPYVEEISYPDGERRWKALFSNGTQQLYRATWFPSLYDTTWWYDVDR